MSGNNAKEPSISQLEYGELAVNYNSKDPSIFIKTKVDSGGEDLVKIAGANSLAGYPDLDDGNGVNLDTRYVNRNGDTMSGQLTLPGGGNANQALQKREVEALISNSDTAAGNYVKLQGTSASQIVTGTGGLAADIYYANRAFVFIENDTFDSGLYAKSDNVIELTTGGIPKIEIGNDVRFGTNIYDKDGNLVTGGGATAKYLCPEGSDVIPGNESNFTAINTDDVGSYIAPAGTDVVHNNQRGQWGAGYSTLFINNSPAGNTGGFFFTCKDPVRASGTNGKYFGVATHIQENGNIISDGYTLGIDTIANIDAGQPIRRTGIYRSNEANWDGRSFGFYVDDRRKLLVHNTEVIFDVRANFKEGAVGLSFRSDPELVQELATKTDLINALTERVAALEARLNQ